MIKNLILCENDYAIEIDQSLLDSIKATPETAFEISCDGKSVILTPVSDPDREKRLSVSQGKINRKFGDDLKRLAK